MEYLEAFLVKYEEHIENIDTLLLVLSLLHNSYRYHFVMNLLKYEGHLKKGDLYNGVIPDGLIYVNDKGIVLECSSLNNGSVFLLRFPPVHEI